MEQIFRITRVSRSMVSKIIDNYSLEQLNTIPEGFSNNLIWNLAHIVVTQQLLVYKLSGLPMLLSDDFVDKFKKGEKPVGKVTQEQVDEIKALLTSTIDQTEIDFGKGIFKEYQEYPTSTGFVINNAKEAMAFNNFHEGLHIGIMMSMRKLV